MFLIPAIDIIKGKCVRLSQGKYDRMTVYKGSPVAIAKKFERCGARRLHIIDLEGAKAGSPVNKATIRAIAKSVNIPIQVGGGIRSLLDAKNLLESGVEKIILGTTAMRDPELLKKLIAEFSPDRIYVSLDIKDGKIATNGWMKKSNKPLGQTLNYLKKMGVQTLIITDVSKDGLLKGPNFDLIFKFKNKGFAIIAAGGVSTIFDIKKLNKSGIYGAIVGKALYENKIDFAKAVSAISRNDLTKRVIPCLDMKNGRVVKGTNFKNFRDAGDPVELGKLYSRAGADELIFLDISATGENRKTLYALVEKIAKEINIPFTVGGGVGSTRDIRKLLASGADKVSICSAAVKNPDLIKDAAEYFGSQCIVISIDAKKNSRKSWNIYIKGGTEKTKIDAIAFAKKMEKFGAGELLVNSLDRDGTGKGFDIGLLKAICGAVNIPVIASSGAGTLCDFSEVFEKTDVSAALGASVFHYRKFSIKTLKKYLKCRNIPIR